MNTKLYVLLAAGVLAISAAEDRKKKCKCDMRTKLVGDGCEYCNPELAAQIAAENERYNKAPCMECGANPPKERK